MYNLLKISAAACLIPQCTNTIELSCSNIEHVQLNTKFNEINSILDVLQLFLRSISCAEIFNTSNTIFLCGKYLMLRIFLSATIVLYVPNGNYNKY